MFYKNYCWAVICYPTCVTNISCERRIIVLSIAVISFVILLFVFFRNLKLNLGFFFFNSHCIPSADSNNYSSFILSYILKSFICMHKVIIYVQCYIQWRNYGVGWDGAPPPGGVTRRLKWYPCLSEHLKFGPLWRNLWCQNLPLNGVGQLTNITLFLKSVEGSTKKQPFFSKTSKVRLKNNPFLKNVEC